VEGVLPDTPFVVDHTALTMFCHDLDPCHDGEQEGAETDVDCGGFTGCDRCLSGKKCERGKDCASGTCEGGLCSGSTCDDAVKNGGESDIDCGGQTSCARCADGKACSAPSDCANGACVLTDLLYDKARTCATPSCGDTTEDGTETGIDCGGDCAGCIGASCAHPGDCASGVCTAGQCAPRSAAVISAGNSACAVTSAGAAVCWGVNFSGEIGDGTTTPRLTPVDVHGLGSGVATIATSTCPPGDGGPHTCAIANGTLACWGNNASGQLGDGTTSPRTIPGPVHGLASVLAVSVGDQHTCAVTTGGGAFCWGSNDSGQLGDGTKTRRSVPVQVHGLATGVASVSAGYRHTCALTTAGAVLCWGLNTYGELGDGSSSTRLHPVGVTGLASGALVVSAGAVHTCALTSAGGVSCWGDNSLGQLGDGTTTNQAVPVTVTGLASGVASVSAGNESTCAVTTGGGVQCWGSNRTGALGDGTTITRTAPVHVVGLEAGVSAVSVGLLTACAVKSNGRALCWGDGSTGELGNGKTEGHLTPVEVYGL
jgi:alpha-tubulin suppressor-like RCC1 family protein